MAVETTTKNKRLSQGDRDALFSFAKKCVLDTQDTTALDAAYDRAADAVAALLTDKFPQKDMRVLAKYNAASPDTCIYVSSGGFGRYDQFCFRDDDKRIPLRPISRGCNSRTPFLLEGKAEEAFRAFNEAKDAFDAAVKTRVADYKALIYAAKTFNEVADIWPEANQLREAIVGTSSSLIVLSNDVVERIKGDAAYSLAEAA